MSDFCNIEWKEMNYTVSCVEENNLMQVGHAGYLLIGGGEKTGAGSVVGAMTLFEPGYRDAMEISSTGNRGTLYPEFWG